MNNDNMNKNGIKKTRRIFIIFIFIFITTVILLVGTYAWFVGITTVAINPFTITVSSGGGIEISLDGEHWRKGNDALVVTQQAVTTTTASPDHAYEGHTNHWPSAGMDPVSSSGEMDASASRLKLYQKISISTTEGGYKLIAGRVDNYSQNKPEADVYLTFDLFIKNGQADPYSTEYTPNADEAIYMLQNPYVTASTSGVNNYGLQNSVRVGFFQIGRTKTVGSTPSTIKALSCASTPVLCAPANEVADRLTHTWNVWEPNDTDHAQNLITYFNSACKKRNSDGTYQNNTACFTLTSPYNTLPTYTVKGDIASSDNIDIYDGINDKTPDSTKLTTYTTYKTSDANSFSNDKKQLLGLAGNSITKVRIYVWLEGQDIDNYDLITSDTSVTISFGLTKDKFNMGSTVSPRPSSGT